ncbi:MAG: hypothetical protein ACYCTL_11350 [Acidimicrobiales bacterium]
MVLLILAVLWAVVLGPSLLRKRAERRGGDSIGAFRHQLRTLQRSGALARYSMVGIDSTYAPAMMPSDESPIDFPAHRGRQVVGREVADHKADRYHLAGESTEAIGRAMGAMTGLRTGLTLLRQAGADSFDQPEQAVQGMTRPRTRRPDPYFRPEACRRRRQVLVALLVATGGATLFGVIPPLHVLLVVAVLGVLALLGYVMLLVYLRGLATEREMKLRYLADRPAPVQIPLRQQPPVVVRRAASR